ncbi:MAG: hypothetical protein PWQ37_102 [Candidatus Petromonas sp.]|jgi:hypothetical protein|nr:hypothetical protein [Candidatus Petromonas sp.]
MNYIFVGAIVLLIILSSIQYILNKILVTLKETKEILYRLHKDNNYKDNNS